jgi:hypothetical protein
MTPTEAKDQYGATHYYPTVRDGDIPQMYYKQEHIHYNDDTSELVWVYLSYANIWMGSSITEDQVTRLKAID